MKSILFCLLPLASCLLPFASCLLPLASCLLPIHFCLKKNFRSERAPTTGRVSSRCPSLVRSSHTSEFNRDCFHLSRVLLNFFLIFAQSLALSGFPRFSQIDCAPVSTHANTLVTTITNTDFCSDVRNFSHLFLSLC